MSEYKLSDWKQIYNSYFQSLNPAQKLNFLYTVSAELVGRSEIQLHVAELHQLTIEGLREEDFKEMGIEREKFLEMVRWDVLSEMSRRKIFLYQKRLAHIKRIEYNWTGSWKDTLCHLLPDSIEDISEGLLWRLAKVAVLSKGKKIELIEVRKLLEAEIVRRRSRSGQRKTHLVIPMDVDQVELQIIQGPGERTLSSQLFYLLIKRLIRYNGARTRGTSEVYY